MIWNFRVRSDRSGEPSGTRSGWVFKAALKVFVSWLKTA